MKTTGLQRRSDGYYFRLRVPLDLRARVGVGELVRRLGDVTKTEAQAEVRAARAVLRSTFTHLRSNPSASAPAMIADALGSPVSHDRVVGPHQEAPGVVIATPTPASPALTTMSWLREVYISEKLAAGDWCSQHLPQVRHTLGAFLNLAGDRGVAEYGRQDVAGFKTWLLQIGRGSKTVNNHLTILGGFFRWAMFAGHREGNPVEGQKLRRNGNGAKEREAFSDSEIRQIFGARFRPAALCGRRSMVAGRNAHYWLPLVMLHSGLRPEEVCQLRVQDIRYEGDIRVFDLTSPDLRIKTEAGRRLVPVHPALDWKGLETLGLNSSSGRLFPSLNPGHNGRLAEAPSRWFNRTWLRDSCGITNPRKVLYSLRHTVATKLKSEGVEESLIAELLGHTNPSITTGRYGKRYPVAKLAHALECLNWGV